MPNNNVFEYAILRFVPQVEREEFINVGVIVFCKDLNFIGAKIQLNETRLQSFAPNCDIALVKANLSAFVNIAEGLPSGGAIAQYLPAERFRWLTATRSTMLQCSKIHPGFCSDPNEKLWQLFNEYVHLEEI